MTSSGLNISAAQADDRVAVVRLWQVCGLVVPHNPPAHDYDFAVGKPSSEILVGRLDSTLVTTVMVGHDGHRGWLYYLAVDPDHQKSGFGAEMVKAAEGWLKDHGVRKVQLMVRDTNLDVLEFYGQIGYDQSTVVVMQRWLDKDTSE